VRRGICLAALGALAVTVPSWGGDGVVALPTAEPSCPDDSGDIYVDCDNGTVTDTRTGLVWLRWANCFGTQTWRNAMLLLVAGLSDIPQEGGWESANDCDLSDGSSPGEWRLPSRSEWLAMVDDANGGDGDLTCNPTITSDDGNACWSESDATCALLGTTCSFFDIQTDLPYWSATANSMDAWWVSLSSGTDGVIAFDSEAAEYRVWPVRGGQ
jgi:hypothetical protein